MVGQIIDWEVKGCCVKFYLSEKDSNKGWLTDKGFDYYSKCNLTPEELESIKNDYTGDDWDDKPYEHNAGAVYNEYVKGIRYNYYPFDAILLEPNYQEVNSPYCKDDFKKRKAPILIHIKDELLWKNHQLDWTYKDWVKASKKNDIECFYLEDLLQSGKMFFNDNHSGIFVPADKLNVNIIAECSELTKDTQEVISNEQ